jgi:hypothetical protein
VIFHDPLACDPGEITDPVEVDMNPIPNDNGQFDRLNTFLRPLKVVHVSNAMKHKEALRCIASAPNTNKTIHLVIEDDSLKQSTELTPLEQAMTILLLLHRTNTAD